MRAGNMRGGEANCTALPVLMAMFGVDDPETFIVRLLALRDFKHREAAAR